MNNLEVEKYFVVYQLVPILNNDSHLSLREVNFIGLTSNWFETKEEAMDAIIKSSLFFQDLIILEKVIVRNYE